MVQRTTHRLVAVAARSRLNDFPPKQATNSEKEVVLVLRRACASHSMPRTFNENIWKMPPTHHRSWHATVEPRLGPSAALYLVFILHPHDVGLFSAERLLFYMIPSQSQRQKCSVFPSQPAVVLPRFPYWASKGSMPYLVVATTFSLYSFPCAAVAVQKGQVWCCEGERDRTGRI